MNNNETFENNVENTGKGTVENRSELVFLYDVSFANPNGDPLENNKPRMDDLTGRCLVTDVRLKRTIRDYLFTHGYDGTEQGKDIFIREVDGHVVSGKERASAYNSTEEFLKKFIDGRLFGAVSAPGNEVNKSPKVFHLTGPVQFSFGHSLHKVEVNFIYGNAAFASSEDGTQKSFREEYNISYGLIGFHGVINENAAKNSLLTNEDVDKLLEAMWNGTRDLLTRSKKTHMPRLLFKVDYKNGFFLGDLLSFIHLVPNPEISDEKQIRSTSDYILDLSELKVKLINHAEKIISFNYIYDESLRFSYEFEIFLKSLDDSKIQTKRINIF